MKINVYTKENKVQYIELNIDVGEFFTIQKALCVYAGNPDMPLDDRIGAVMMTDTMNETNDFEKIELEEFN